METEQNKDTRQLVYLPIICHYAPEAGYIQSLIRALTSSKYQFVVDWLVGDSLISRARNEAAHRFLFDAFNGECACMVFIDCDVSFKREDLERLIDNPADIACGFYPKKQLSTAWVCNTLEGEKADESGKIKLSCGGTGFMKITRAPFLKMIEAHPDIAFKHDEIGTVQHDLFPVGVIPSEKAGELGRYMSEDWFFCYRARKLGFDIIGDTKISLKHTGQMTFPVTLAALGDAVKAHAAVL